MHCVCRTLHAKREKERSPERYRGLHIPTLDLSEKRLTDKKCEVSVPRHIGMPAGTY